MPVSTVFLIFKLTFLGIDIDVKHVGQFHEACFDVSI